MKHLKFILLALSALIISACAGKHPNPHDPYEGFNRPTHSFNTAFDKAISRPVAKGYTIVIPKKVRRGFGHAFSNLGDTRTAVIDLTQGRLSAAIESIHRFVFNSTFGVLGFIDLTETFKLPEKHSNDFGTTLAKMGWANSNYLVIPFMGPSTSRDAVGVVGDVLATPYNYALNTWQAIGLTGTSLVHLRSELLDIDSVSKSAALDPYVFQREAYLQFRNQRLKDRGVKYIRSAHENEALLEDDDDNISIAELARQRNDGDYNLSEDLNAGSSMNDDGELSLSELARQRNQ